MSRYINKRVLNETEYIIKSKKTIREVAKKFKTSKSTVHKDLNDRLKIINNDLYKKVKEILDEHILIRHINGGEATRQKFLKINKGM